MGYELYKFLSINKHFNNLILFKKYFILLKTLSKMFNLLKKIEYS